MKQPRPAPTHDEAAAARSHALFQMSAALGGSQTGGSQADYHELSQHRLQDWSSQSSPQGQPQPRQRNRQHRTPPSGGSRDGNARASTPGSRSYAGSRGRAATPPSEGQQSYRGQGWGKVDDRASSSDATTSPVRCAESVLTPNRYQWPSETTGSNIDYTSSYCGSVATTMRQLEPTYAEPPRLNSIARKPRGRRLHSTALPPLLTHPLGAKCAKTSRIQPDADSPIKDHPSSCSSQAQGNLPVYSFFMAVTIKQNNPLHIFIEFYNTTAPGQSPMVGGLAPISCLAYPPLRECHKGQSKQKCRQAPPVIIILTTWIVMQLLNRT
jgi:hypothetical protein